MRTYLIYIYTAEGNCVGEECGVEGSVLKEVVQDLEDDGYRVTFFRED